MFASLIYIILYIIFITNHQLIGKWKTTIVIAFESQISTQNCCSIILTTALLRTQVRHGSWALVWMGIFAGPQFALSHQIYQRQISAWKSAVRHECLSANWTNVSPPSSEMLRHSRSATFHKAMSAPGSLSPSTSSYSAGLHVVTVK